MTAPAGRALAAACGLVLLLAPWLPAAAQAPLRVVSSNGVKAVLEQVRADAERIAGRPLAMTFETSSAIRARVAAGESFDLAVLTREALDELVASGRVAPGVRALGHSGIGIGVRAGSLRLDLQTGDALKHVLLAVGSLTYAADGASRPAITHMLDTFGIGDALASRTTLEQGSVRATARVVRGDADMVITLVSEIVPVPGLELAGLLPEEFQRYVSFAAGVGADSTSAAAATAVADFLAGAEATPAFVASGIER